jgi:uncharacterized protein with GYD domain
MEVKTKKQILFQHFKKKEIQSIKEIKVQRRYKNMPDYLLQIKYEQKAAQALIAKPHSREEAIKPAIEKLGGKIKNIWFSLGRYDVVAVLTLPDNLTMKALTIAMSATGFIKDFKATPLLSIDESIEAMKKASTIELRIQ